LVGLLCLADRRETVIQAQMKYEEEKEKRDSIFHRYNLQL